MTHHVASPEINDRRPTVLLVDDDEVNLLLTGAALRERGFDIATSNGGEDALGRLASWTPDIVVLDALMPELDGFETCVRLRHMPGFDNVPVLMLTGLDDEASINRAYQVGATDFFVKATQWSLLAGRLRYLLRASRTRQELERSKAKLARAQDLARMGSFDWWVEEGRSFVNGLELSEEGLRVFGYGPDDRTNLRDMLRMIAPTDREPLLRLARQILYQVSVLATDVPMTLHDGRYRIIHVEAEPEFDEHGHCCSYTGIVQDVTDRRIAEDRIRHLANYDALTNLPNRRQLIWRAERSLEFARRLGHQVALLLIDLDRFKLINDTLGHAAGDELLMEVAYRLRGCVRHCEQLFEGVIETAGARSHRTLEAVGRLGGDEFVALLPEVADEEDAQRVAARILEALREPVVVAGQDCFATASVGIALFPRDGNSFEDLLRNSDVAMYAVKSQGRNDAMVYTPRMASRGKEKLVLESALHKAIERDELVLFYQPKVDVLAARMVGAEALMRWRRGDLLIQPADFIPLAEETGLIVPLSEWALRQAAHQARLWRDAFGFDDSIAVNLPNKMFERTDLIERITTSAREEGIPNRMIQLEITETGLMKDLHSVIPSLHRLTEIGIQIAIDDFGTGYSSLAYLTSLPISEVKIDRSFVRELGVSPQSMAVVTAIIALARSLGLKVVAEGVENLRQQDVLHRLGCSLMQGFMFSKPMPPEEIQRWLEQVVLPRKAPWIASVSGAPSGTDDLQDVGRRV
ncbi:MAG TPA: EAL domain-containing protein [Burkholderiaceae bacterium]|nr:EAL domain-containing protein [Burkholderiaceae bacterium]